MSKMVCAVLFLTCLVPGVSAQSETPAEVVIAYLEANMARDFAKAYSLLSAADQAFTPEAEYVASSTEVTAMIPESITKGVKHEVKETRPVTGDDDRMEVVVLLTVPNLEVVEEKLMEAVSGRTDIKTEAEAMEVMGEVLATIDVPHEQVEKVFQVVRENGQWKVFDNLAAKAEVE